MAGFDFNTPSMDMSGFGNGNPFDMGLLQMLAANNPGLISQVAANNGITPPTAPSMVNGVDTSQSPLGAFLTPSAFGPSGMSPGGVGPATAPGAVPTRPYADSPMNPWAALQGFKGPQVPAPIMSGGVAGAQKAPDQTNPAPGASTQLNALIQQIISGMNPGGTPTAPVRPVGTLGSFLGR